MADVSVSLILAIALTFFLAGVVKGVTGMGLPTLAMAVLGAIMSPVAAAGLLIFPSFFTNVWQLVAGPSFAALSRRLWFMMLGIVLGTLAGSSILASGHTRWTMVRVVILLV
jgi:uncharacterized protein